MIHSTNCSLFEISSVDRPAFGNPKFHTNVILVNAKITLHVYLFITLSRVIAVRIWMKPGTLEKYVLDWDWTFYPRNIPIFPSAKPFVEASYFECSEMRWVYISFARFCHIFAEQNHSTSALFLMCWFLVYRYHDNFTILPISCDKRTHRLLGSNTYYVYRVIVVWSYGDTASYCSPTRSYAPPIIRQYVPRSNVL